MARFLTSSKLEGTLIRFQDNVDKQRACLILSSIEITELEIVYKKVKLLLLIDLQDHIVHLGQMSGK